MSLRTTIVIALASVAANALPVQNEVIACPEVVTEPAHFVACYQTNQMAKVMGLSGHFPFTFDNKTFIGSGEGSAPGPLAFVAGDDSLETLLRVNKDRADSVKDQQFTEAEAGYRLTAAMTSLVGFPRSAVLSSKPNNFTFVVFKSSAVFKSSSAVSMFGSEQPVVPIFSFFAEFVKSSSGFEIPLDLTRDLVAAYAEQPNPMAAFSKVTGCDEEKVRALEYGVRKSPTDFIEALVPDILDAGCSEKFYKVYKTARTASRDYPLALKGEECVTYFVEKFKNLEFDLAADSFFPTANPVP